MANSKVILYHGCRASALDSILEHGLKLGSIGLIWATESPIEAQRFADNLEYPNKCEGRVVKIQAPRTAFFFERSMSGQKSRLGQRVARFTAAIPPAMLQETKQT